MAGRACFDCTCLRVITYGHSAAESAEWWPTSLKGAKGRAPNEKEDAALGDCVWGSAAGQAMGQNLECVVTREAAALGAPC